MTTPWVVDLILLHVAVGAAGIGVVMSARVIGLLRAEIQELREQVSRVARGAQKP